MLPKVVIVGRPNVGKSSLLNMLAGKLVSIVDPTPGVTRDRVSTAVELPPEVRGQKRRAIELVDTGGYGIEDTQNLTAEVEEQIAHALAQASLILFITDAQTGVMPLDREVAQVLRRSKGAKGKPVLLLANKVDSERHEAGAAEAACLGFGSALPVSAVSGFNHDALVAAIREHLPVQGIDQEAEKIERGVLLAIVGKRNAGKSTLVNLLAGEERMIVSELEGTTRDSVDVRFEMEGKVFTAIDTAGVRKGKSVHGDVEYYSQHRALRSVRRADVVLFMIDATVPLRQVDEHLANEVIAHYKPCLVVVNKWDLAQEALRKDLTSQEKYIAYLDKALAGLNYAPVAFVSAKRDKSMRDVVKTALTLHEQAGQRVTTSVLNDVVQKIMAEKPPTSSIGRRPKIYYMTQTKVRPPTIVLFVNDPSMFDAGYQRYLMNRFRETMPYADVPIRLLIRGKERDEEQAQAAHPRKKLDRGHSPQK